MNNDNAPVLENILSPRVHINIAAADDGRVRIAFSAGVSELNIPALEAMQLASVLLQKSIMAATGQSDSRIVRPN